MEGALLFLLIGVGLIIYFIPSIVGWNKTNAGGIIVLNLFLGWTLLGWIGALVWALSSAMNNRVGNMNALSVGLGIR